MGTFPLISSLQRARGDRELALHGEHPSAQALRSQAAFQRSAEAKTRRQGLFPANREAAPDSRSPTSRNRIRTAGPLPGARAGVGWPGIAVLSPEPHGRLPRANAQGKDSGQAGKPARGHR